MNVIDLVLDNVEHVVSLEGRSAGTKHPLWTTRTPVTDLPGWSFRPARPPMAARTLFPLGHSGSVC